MGKLTSLTIEKKGINVSQIIVGLMNLWKWDLTRLELIEFKHAST